MSRENHQDIRIGTLAGLADAPNYLAQILPHGFESFELTSWQFVKDKDGKPINHKEHAKKVLDVLAGKAIITSIGVYGNPLRDDETAVHFDELIRNAHHYGATVVCGFAGALEDRSVEANMPRFKEVWTPLAKLAEDHNVKIAFENCDMGGTWDKPSWNIAHCPRGWEMMFNEVPSDAMGLEWEPCHQMNSFVDPIPQLRKWVSKVHHVHGKDATINWDEVKLHGTRCGNPVIFHRTPGFGDSNWTDIITILRQAGWQGTIDIEGWHDPVYRDDLEMTGQVYGLNYLKTCRGGPFVTNPK